MEGIPTSRPEPGRQGLTKVVSKSAENGPIDPGHVHRSPGSKKQFSEIGVHAADDVILHREAPNVRRDDVLPGEIAVPIYLGA
jgi:hypothetical protein